MNKLLSFLVIFLVVSCIGRTGNNPKGGDEGEREAPQKIVIPSIPAMMTDPQDQAEYMAQHYWDNFDFGNVLYIDQPEITEQAFADYVAIMGVVPGETARRSISYLVDKSLVNREMYDHFAELFEKYLYDPNSPLRNEELYILFLESVISQDKLEDIDKLRPQAQLKSSLKNRVGEKAADLVLTDADGFRIRLYDIKSEYTLLYFNNPDCNYCAEVTDQLQNSNYMLTPLIRQGVLKVVAVYPDEDLKAWREHYSDMPIEWYRTYDASLEIRNKQIYDIRAIPSLYLLSRDKTVVLKDIDKVYILEQYFASQGY